MTRPTIIDLDPYRIVDFGEDVYFEVRSEDALGNPKFDSCLQLRGDRMTLPAGLVFGLLRLAEREAAGVEAEPEEPAQAVPRPIPRVVASSDPKLDPARRETKPAATGTNGPANQTDSPASPLDAVVFDARFADLQAASRRKRQREGVR